MNGFEDDFPQALDTALGANAVPLDSVENILARGRAAAHRRARRRAMAVVAACTVGMVASLPFLERGTSDTPAADHGDDRTKTGRPTASETRRTGQTDPRLQRYYRQCATLATTRGSGNRFARSEPPTGRVGVIDTSAVTVVVANRRYSWTCNLKPDHAFSAGRPLAAQRGAAKPTVKNFAVAINALENFDPKTKGSLVWAGGALPQDSSTVTYRFPSGHVQQAVTAQGFWVYQYVVNKDIPFQGPSILVDVDGKQVSLLPGLIGYCNQISHGC